MGKKRKGRKGAGARRWLGERAAGGGGGGGPAGAKPSPFERAGVRRKFGVVGQAGKKERRAVHLGRARAEGQARRERTLLLEHRRRGNVNSFEDRRFGEGVEEMGEEDKALMRFQAERRRQVKHSARFALGEDGAEDLQHLGRPIDEVEGLGAREAFGAGEYDEEFLQRGMDAAFSFGGGFEPKQGPGSAEPERRKSKKEVMAELIAKSKFFKAEKAREKEQDLDLLDALDSEFKEVLQGPARAQLLNRGSSQRDPAGRERGAQGPADEAYDRSASSLAHEMRGRAADALPTPEELAEKEKQRLQALEKQRLKRMRDASVGDADFLDLDEVKGFRGRRLRQKMAELEERGALPARTREPKGTHTSGDALEENFSFSDDEGGAGGEEPSGSDYSDEYSDAEEADGGDGPAGEEEAAGWEEKTVKELQKDLKALGLPTAGRKAELIARLEEHFAAERQAAAAAAEEEEEEVPAAAAREDGGAANGEASGDEEPEALPFVLPVPDSYEAFRRTVEGRPPADLAVAIERIQICNAAALGASNRRRLQVFFGIVVQHFVNLARAAPVPLAHLDALARPILEMGRKVPLFAATLARARLDKLHQKFVAARRDGAASAWPATSALLLFQLYSRVYPVTDANHAVVTPMNLLMNEYLALSPVASGDDMLRCLALCDLLLAQAAATGRYFPEVFTALKRLLGAVARAGPGGAAFTFPATAGGPPPPLAALLAGGAAGSGGGGESGQFAALALERVRTWAVGCGRLPSYPELLQDVRGFAAAVGAEVRDGAEGGGLQGTPEVRRALEALAALESGDDWGPRPPLVVERMLADRKAIRTFNPVYEEGFERGQDYDIDRERAARKKLRRQLKKETRGAVRELRKDNRYLAEVKERERVAHKRGLQKAYAETTADLLKAP